MANNFKRFIQANIGTTLSVVNNYVVPANNTTTIIGLTLTNVSGNTIFADAQVSNASANVYIVKGAPVPVGGALVVVGGDQKIVLQAADKVMVKSDAATSLDVILSVLETTI